ncbi:replication endonuclease [Photobacterium sp. TY1-4]|uniref:replication endonuclease n=1 Tax=Photobacterium sp. TY1-4 TaxID=2899122 RepID=UPI0021BF3596|nr:replication endonuclease [Photobacterium sp. TY1-4]UXI00451.1 replication endonuclease [Photobacterium sp. TY1-4]
MSLSTFTTAQKRAASRACQAWGEMHVFPQLPKIVEVSPESQSFDREPEGMTVTERKLYEVNPADHAWRRQFFAGLPDYLARYFGKRYVSIFNSKGRSDANTFLRERMGGELQRRIRLVMEQYNRLPTWNKVKSMSDNADQSDFDDEQPFGQYSLNLEAVKPKRANNQILAELERDELKEMAFLISRIMKTKVKELSDNLDESQPYPVRIIDAYQQVAVLGWQFGIRPPVKKKRIQPEDAECGLLQLQCEKWWLRRLVKSRNIMREHLAIAMGQVSKRASAYCSFDCLNEYQAQQKRNWEAIENMVLFDEETGEEAEMKDMVLKSVANPAIRRHELMTRTRGFEDIADAMGLSGLFLTLTTPAKYHNSYKKGGFIPHWNGASPRRAQANLNNTWARIRAKLDRDGIRWFGIRTAEPHHDGTPHWHILLWLKEEDVAAAREIFIDYAIAEDRAELLPRKTKNHEYVGPLDYRPRCDVKYIDPELGSATGYIAKYISKNIDGYAMDGEKDDETGEDIKETAKHVTAWKSRWNIRQFQFFGGAPVTTYRELRRYANLDKAKFMDYCMQLTRKELNRIYEDMTADLHGPRLPANRMSGKALLTRIGNGYQPKVQNHDGSISETMQSADAGNWQGYVMGQGGPFVARESLLIRNVYEVTPYGSPYGEAVSKIQGFQAAGEVVKTRLRTWTIMKKSELTEEAEAGALALSGSSAASRSSVNNCTQSDPVSEKGTLEDAVSRIVDIRALGDAVPAGIEDRTFDVLLRGGNVAVGDGRSIKLRGGELDENGNRRPMRLIEFEHEPDDLNWLNFEGWPEDMETAAPAETSTTHQQPQLSPIPEPDWEDDGYPLI